MAPRDELTLQSKVTDEEEVDVLRVRDAVIDDQARRHVARSAALKKHFS